MYYAVCIMYLAFKNNANLFQYIPHMYLHSYQIATSLRTQRKNAKLCTLRYSRVHFLTYMTYMKIRYLESKSKYRIFLHEAFFFHFLISEKSQLGNLVKGPRSNKHRDVCILQKTLHQPHQHFYCVCLTWFDMYCNLLSCH